MIKALRFVVEEESADDPEKLHVAPADDYLPDGRLPVAIIDRQWLAKTLDLLAEKEIFPEAIRVETLLLPIEESGISILWNGKDGFMRTGQFTGGALDTGTASHPPQALKLAIAEAIAQKSAPEKITLYLANGTPPPNTALWTLDLGTLLEIKQEKWNMGESATNVKERGINLLQGDIVPAHQMQRAAQQGRLTVSLILIIGLAYLGYVFTDWMFLKMEAEKLNGQMHDTFKTAFPKAKSIVDPPLQMRRNLAELRWRAGGKDDSDLIPMLATITQAIAQTAKIAGFEYDKGIVKIELVTTGDKEFFVARDNLVAQGLNVKPGPGKRYDYGFKTQLTVTRKNIQ
ncbi:hypothetical protein MNBD_NITROSPINAE01-590 [hydrothermal vent metagenome]|uniref:General secretion pathway protein L n=1 Tax=hydrothermal vent metagenome TaxID=652676 RepID=A0A3B1C7M1_9ZZZZ